MSSEPEKGDRAPCGLWYIEIQRLNLRGDEADTIKKLRDWVKTNDESQHHAARSAFADGIFYGMRWAGTWAKCPLEASEKDAAEKRLVEQKGSP